MNVISTEVVKPNAVPASLSCLLNLAYIRIPTKFVCKLRTTKFLTRTSWAIGLSKGPNQTLQRLHVHLVEMSQAKFKPKRFSFGLWRCLCLTFSGEGKVTLTFYSFPIVSPFVFICLQVQNDNAPGISTRLETWWLVTLKVASSSESLRAPEKFGE